MDSQSELSRFYEMDSMDTPLSETLSTDVWSPATKKQRGQQQEQLEADGGTEDIEQMEAACKWQEKAGLGRDCRQWTLEEREKWRKARPGVEAAAREAKMRNNQESIESAASPKEPQTPRRPALRACAQTI